MPLVTINGIKYETPWNESLNAYAWEAPSAEAANRLLGDNHNAKMFVPGLRITFEAKPSSQPVAKPIETVVAPKMIVQPIPTPQKEIAEPKSEPVKAKVKVGKGK